MVRKTHFFLDASCGQAYTFFMDKIAFGILVILVFAYYVLLSFGQDILALPEDIQVRSELLKSAVETMAILVAGYWAYVRFIWGREKYPYPKIEYRIVHYFLENNIVYLSVFVTVTNEGKTKLDLGKGVIYVRKVSPLPENTLEIVRNSETGIIRSGDAEDLFIDNKQRVAWPTLGKRKWDELRKNMQELEPGQTREIQFGFLFEENVRVVEIISSVNYEKSRWELSELYSLKD